MSDTATDVSTRSGSDGAPRLKTTLYPATARVSGFRDVTWMPYHTRMEVRLFPNSTRPGVGMKPRRESQRPLLPTHSRHCPVLEAGSAAGFMVYPPLEPNESFHIEYQGEGQYQFVYPVK